MKAIDPALYADLEYRGLVRQVTSPSLAERLSKEPFTLYCGFDPTADTLHIGSLLPLMTLKRFQKAGHSIIAVVGGATGMVGDPSGKTSERQLQTAESLEKNVAGITRVISKFLDLSSGARVANNYDWFKNFGYLEFLRDVGKHFSVNQMMAKESVRARLEDRDHGISYTEFSYMLLQAYDFYHLYETEGCRLQIGGSDQWGNITAGTELIRRMRAVKHGEVASAENPMDEEEIAFGFTMPLVLKSDGTKFGKSESGTIWLSPDRTSPYQFYQFLLQTADADAVTYLKYFTMLTRPQIEALETSLKASPEKREAQGALATELTRMIHGEAALQRAQQATRALFGAEIRELDRETLEEAFAGAPTLTRARQDLSPGVAVIDLLVESALVPSKGAARKEIQGGGVYLNNERVTDPAALVTENSLIGQFAVVLRKGKKNYHLVRFQ